MRHLDLSPTAEFLTTLACLTEIMCVFMGITSSTLEILETKPRSAKAPWTT